MLKVYYRQKFRIRNRLTNKVERLNQSVDKNGNDIWKGGFNHYHEAYKELQRYLAFNPAYKPYLLIETFSSAIPHDLSISKEMSERIRGSKSKGITGLHLFSGKGLADNTQIPRREENKYQPNRWYGRDVSFAQSVERNKGLSLIHKLKDPKSSKDIGFIDSIPETVNDGTFTSYNIAHKLRDRINKGEFPDRLAMKKWLHDRGYNVRAQKRIISQAFNPQF